MSNPGAVAIHRAYFKLISLGFIRGDIPAFEPPPAPPKERKPISAPPEVKNILEPTPEQRAYLDKKHDVKYVATRLGMMASKLAAVLPPEDIKMIMSGFGWGVPIMDLITIATFNQFEKQRYLVNTKSKFVQNIEFEHLEELCNLGFNIPVNKQLYSYHYFKLLFCDDFVESVMIFAAFNRKMREVEFDIGALMKWCEKIGIVFDVMSEIVKKHEEIADALIASGMDVYYKYDQGVENMLGAYEEFKSNDRVIMYKQCIYEGYKLNIARWDGATYRTREGLAFGWKFYDPYPEEWNRFDEKKPMIPKRIMYNKLDLKYNKMTNLYVVVPNRVSVLDGFIYDDPYL
jgi:hypothetical protein